MKTISFLYCYLLSYAGYCQLYDSSLISFFQREYETSLLPECEVIRLFSGPNYPFVSKVNEVFNGYFDNVKLYTVTFLDSVPFRHQAPYFPAFYAIDNKGKRLSFKNYEDFYEFVNKSAKPLSNLDKAYLFLFIYLRIFDREKCTVTEPILYNSELTDNSVIASDKRCEIFFDWGFKGYFLPNKDSINIRQCSASRIDEVTMFSTEIECKQDVKSYKCKYKYLFNFDKNNNFHKIKIDTTYSY